MFNSFVRRSALLTAAVLAITPSASAFDPISAASVFSRLAVEPELSNPSVSLIDVSTGEIVFESNAFSQRKPASTMKILAAAATLKHLQPDQVFTTRVSLGTVPDSIVIDGEFDPWISMDHRVATKMKRTSFPRIAFNSLSKVKESSGGSIKKLKVYYNGIYANEVASYKAFYKKRGVTAAFIKVSDEKATSLVSEEILTSESPQVIKMLDWFLLWSDNQLSERMAKIAAKYAGNEFNDEGVAVTFAEILISFGINPAQIVVIDASGLSRQNKITAHVLAQLLYKIHSDPVLSRLIESLPVGGESGTLRNRYIETAPDAVGLVKAKTGTLTGTVSLAGYVQSGDREYAFVIIADKIRRTNSASDRARKTLDRYLAKIAAPLAIPAPESATVVTEVQIL
ncbi:D-alanyl-D-alanine carboxypeptidase / D-alanyl-D-alanine-endopeptidase (penicillin-binding protein 4) [Candidatus Planktophila lacus]|uniref:D-alanyl-D-alanine carboxypeptidase / D-alanyl-D-alanine-endopeptidase (Penicillin-binding protein 4) n=1 Tax=Candidatus Planktophila lacus TaxID=1884913 RepID=A0AAC9YSG1_9ACTN|nr:D-alanyl-D-alanine carboxypeptidase / D-alanyl-D-alanine-endopeptidase (penicillin-binding protein 4) [Candidatus Planktophila lacus]